MNGTVPRNRSLLPLRLVRCGKSGTTTNVWKLDYLYYHLSPYFLHTLTGNYCTNCFLCVCVPYFLPSFLCSTKRPTVMNHCVTCRTAKQKRHNKQTTNKQIRPQMAHSFILPATGANLSPKFAFVRNNYCLLCFATLLACGAAQSKSAFLFLWNTKQSTGKYFILQSQCFARNSQHRHFIYFQLNNGGALVRYTVRFSSLTPLTPFRDCASVCVCVCAQNFPHEMWGQIAKGTGRMVIPYNGRW